MKKILVPTDFSDTALNAYCYAQQLASQFAGAAIQVVHIYMPQVSGEYNLMPPTNEILKSREKSLEEFMEEAHQNLKGRGVDQVPDKAEVLIGFAVDEIAQASKDFDLIVMGTTGEGGFLGKIFGTISTGVFQRAHCPVLMVPSKIEFQKYDNLLYASNLESCDEKMVNKLKEFNAFFNATIHFIHVSEKKDDDFDKIKQELFDVLFKESDPTFSFEIIEQSGESISESINEYAEKHGVEMVVMVTKHRNLWNQIFHKSRTREMVLANKIPVLVLHSDNQ